MRRTDPKAEVGDWGSEPLPDPTGRAKGNLGRCKSCGAEVLWVRTDKGRPMPLDCPPSALMPSDAGPVTGVFDEWGRARRGYVTDETDPEHVLVSVSHFATCPNANRHRKSR